MPIQTIIWRIFLNHPIRVKKNTLALAVALACVPVAQAQAQDAAPAAKPQAALQRITVTGSNIKRVDAETASPIQIITREELVRGGATSLNEVLRTISSNVGGQDENRSSDFAAGAAGLNLRGIGSQATLVLINGRRLAPYAQPEFQTTFVDLNSIPVGAVERIEVLKDGASAIYGSEAMAGVVNVILRNTFEGVEASASIGQTTYGDGQQKRASVIAGVGSLVEDHFNVYASLEVRQRKPMLMSNRPDYISTEDWTQYGYKDGRSLYTFPGNLFWTDKASNKRVYKALDPNCPNGQTVSAATFLGPAIPAMGDVCLYDNLKNGTYNAAGKTDRIGLTSRATWQPNEDLTLFGELMFNQNKALVTGMQHWLAGQPGQITGALPITHPQYPKELIDPVTGKTRAGGNGQVRVRATLADFPGQGQDNTTNFGRYLFGAKGTMHNWDWESTFLYNTSRVTSFNSSAILKTPFGAAYNNGSFILGGTTQNAALYNAITTTAASQFESGVKQWDAKLSGELFNLPAGPVNIATGLEARNEYLTTQPDPQSVAGELYHQAQSGPGISNSRNVTSIYGELSVPIIKDLEAQFAVRHDRYSDYGNSTTPKVGLRWNALPSLLLRGTYAEGFRAPTLVENSTDVKDAFYNGFVDPARCNATFKDGCDWNSAYQSGSNPQLQPETAKSFTLGFVWEPATWMNVSVDAWRIRRINEIGTYNLDKVLADPARYAGDPAAVITRDPLTAADRAAGATAGEITNIKLLLTNVALTEVNGVDVDLKGKVNMGEYGKLEPHLQVSFTESYKNAPSPDELLIEYAGTRGTPRYQATLGLGWKKAAWELSADIVHVGTMSAQNDYTVPCAVGEEGYPNLCNGIASFNTVNLGASYTGFKDMTLKMAVQNAFNRMPPFVPYSSLGYYSPLHSAMGRYVQLTAEYKFK